MDIQRFVFQSDSGDGQPQSLPPCSPNREVALSGSKTNNDGDAADSDKIKGTRRVLVVVE